MFAVPGRVDDRSAQGCHRLLRDGAALVESVDDILEHLGPLAHPAPKENGTQIRHPAELQLNDLEQKVLSAIGTDPTSVDRLVSQTGLPVARILSTLSVLEMRRIIRRVTGTTVVRI